MDEQKNNSTSITDSIKWPLDLLKYLLPATNYLITFSGHDDGQTSLKQITYSSLILSLFSRVFKEVDTFIVHFDDCEYSINNYNYETEILITFQEQFIRFSFSPEEYWGYYRNVLNLYPSPSFDTELKEK